MPGHVQCPLLWGSGSFPGRMFRATLTCPLTTAAPSDRNRGMLQPWKPYRVEGMYSVPHRLFVQDREPRSGLYGCIVPRCHYWWVLYFSHCHRLLYEGATACVCRHTCVDVFPRRPRRVRGKLMLTGVTIEVQLRCSISYDSERSESIPNTKNLAPSLRSASLSCCHAGNALSMACQNSGLWRGSCMCTSSWTMM